MGEPRGSPTRPSFTPPRSGWHALIRFHRVVVAERSPWFASAVDEFRPAFERVSLLLRPVEVFEGASPVLREMLWKLRKNAPAAVRTHRRWCEDLRSSLATLPDEAFARWRRPPGRKPGRVSPGRRPTGRSRA